jgi:hypothetical protein
VYRTDTAEEVGSYSNYQNKARGYGETKEQAEDNALRGAAQQIPNTFFDSVASKAKLVHVDSRYSSVATAEPKMLETEEQSISNPNSSAINTSRRVLLAVKPQLLSIYEQGEAEVLVKEFSVTFSTALTASGLTVADSANLDERDKAQLDGELHPRIRRDPIRTYPQPTQILTPQKRNLSWLPYRLVIEVSFHSSDSEEYLGRFMTEASIQIMVYLTKNGEIVSSYSNYQDKARGYGSSKTQARRNAIRAAAQGIPQKFIKEIANGVKK